MENYDPNALELRANRGAVIQGLYLAVVVFLPLGYALHLDAKGRSPLEYFHELSPAARHAIAVQVGAYFLAAVAVVAYGRSRRIRLSSHELISSAWLTRKACPVSELAKATLLEGSLRSGGPFLELWRSDGSMVARIGTRAFPLLGLRELVTTIKARNPSFQVAWAVQDYLKERP